MHVGELCSCLPCTYVVTPINLILVVLQRAPLVVTQVERRELRTLRCERLHRRVGDLVAAIQAERRKLRALIREKSCMFSRGGASGEINYIRKNKKGRLWGTSKCTPRPSK